MSPNDKTTHLLRAYQESAGRRPGESSPHLDKIVFGIAAVVAVAFVVWGFVSPDGLGNVASTMLNATMKNLGWLFVIASSLFTIFAIVVAVSRFGKIPLGKDGERPQYRTASWIAMMFATGMGIGLVFYGVGEPLFFYMSPPPGTVDASTTQAVDVAMGPRTFPLDFVPVGNVRHRRTGHGLWHVSPRPFPAFLEHVRATFRPSCRQWRRR